MSRLVIGALIAAACTEAPQTPQPPPLPVWCADAPVPNGWRHRESPVLVGQIAPIETYGGRSEADMPEVHNEISLGLSRGDLSEFVVTESKAQERLASGGLAETENPAIRVDGFVTYEALPRTATRLWVLVGQRGNASGRCAVYQSATLAQTCDFFVVDESRGVSLRIFVPTRIVAELPRILNDLDPVIEYISTHCPM